MKYILFTIFGLLFLSKCIDLNAQVMSEGALIESIVQSLQNNDSRVYCDLFPGIDSMSTWVLQHADKKSDAYRRMYYLQENYYAKLDFDSSVRAQADSGFQEFNLESKKYGVHWDKTVFVRYELEKIRTGRGLIPEKIAPLRFMGYIVVKDMLTRKTYTFTVYDILQVNGLWYGGELIHIFEATSKEEYETQLANYKKKEQMRLMGIVDTTAEKNAYSFDEDVEDEENPIKDIVDRKFYRGTFDNEIQVQLYVRHIKGGCPEVICSWEALFKFGDQDEFVPMDVSRTKDGKWIFNEELGGMELILKGNAYTGTYASSSDKTEYEVKLTESPITNKRLLQLDEILDYGPDGKPDKK